MANLFDIQSNEVCDEIPEVLIVDVEPTESERVNSRILV